ncbi:RagB/SusD family nutrient uptake outer membrane protein [Flavivirga sp. 57AJ16]|uniref:RagB/SusD family nutrient uptake outer membrane protein n=1 Tax=Flavivirga sp. 57AJ16 TaxID=3025307 RepID=UPI0023660D29|nr:RagB/SusD family nutrient uptake outer membrane protein [Flavivirga sp. 57AJ16]MDD7885252.1 RagB/SusD family nutrient uptake outer membrane protein [Flavivirga sp. 57AJ16]
MKFIKYIYLGIIYQIVLFNIYSCQIAEELEDRTPKYALDADKAIVDEVTAELALIGVYSGFRQRGSVEGMPQIFLLPSILSGTGTPNLIFNDTPEMDSYVINNPISTDATYNVASYARMYEIINRCNWLIEKVNLLSGEDFMNPTRKTEILGEAKAIRATCHFYLLRLWGQFYDLNSEYGIVLRTEPVRSDKALPRNTVAETYDLIIADLDEAIANAPTFKARYYANKTYSKGLKAKVLLYKGDYPNAALLAKDVIENSGSNFMLAANYMDQFDNTSTSVFDNPEVLFGSKGDKSESILGIGNFTGFWMSVTGALNQVANDFTTINGQNITHDGDRIASTIYDAGAAFGLDTNKYITRGSADLYEMVYHLKMDEVYLIYAEAAARSAENVTPEALDALNAIRERAGATSTGGDGFETYPESISFSEFLEAVRIEKYIELAIENGEEWFDLVRYHFVDGFDVTTVKPTATNPDKYILPIETNSIQVGGNVVDQNPSY